MKNTQPEPFETHQTKLERSEGHGLDAIPEPVHPKKSTVLINYVLLFFLAVAAIGIAVILHWSFASDDILKVNNAPFPTHVIKDSPDSNGIVVLSVDLCKNTGANGKVRTSFVSTSREVFLPISDEHIPKGCLKQDIPVIIPKDLTPDTYQVKFRVTYDINPLKKGIANEFLSKPFTVAQ